MIFCGICIILASCSSLRRRNMMFSSSADRQHVVCRAIICRSGGQATCRPHQQCVLLSVTFPLHNNVFSFLHSLPRSVGPRTYPEDSDMYAQVKSGFIVSYFCVL